MTATIDRPLAKHALYKLQERALTDEAAASECAYRFADEERANTESGRPYWLKIVAAYLAGLRGDDDPYLNGRGGNFVRPLRRAYVSAARLRVEQQILGRRVGLPGGRRGKVDSVMNHRQIAVLLDDGQKVIEHPRNVMVLPEAPPTAEGACPTCEGTGHSPSVRDMLCGTCGGTGRIDDEEE